MLNKNEEIKLREVRKSLLNVTSRLDASLLGSTRFNTQRLLAMVGAEMRKCPKILDCDHESIEAAVSLAARLRLEPDSALGYIYFIPYGRTLQVIVGYKGLLDLAMRAPNLRSIYAQEVYENDDFEVILGTEKKIYHRPSLGERGALVAVYAIAEYDSGIKEIEVMNRHEIELVRTRSKAGQSGPWISDPGAMSRKTVLRRICKYIPRAIDVHIAVAADEAVERGDKLDSDNYVEGEIVGETEVAEIGETMQNSASNLTAKLKSNAPTTTNVGKN